MHAAASPEYIILIGAVLLFVSIILGQSAYRFGIPTLVLFLITGMLAGSEGILGIHFDNPKIAQFIGIIALNFILFSGGLDTDWKSVKPVLGQGVALSTLGVLFTAGFCGTFIWLITDWTIYESLLLGSIFSSTDAAAVFSILRSKSLSLKNNLRPMLEFESGSNDPMAYLLTILFLGLITNPEGSVGISIVMFFVQMIVGVGLGILFGMMTVWLVRHVKMGYVGLYPVMIIALMFFTFAATDRLYGNGYLAVYVAALWLGNHKIPHRLTTLSVYDGFAWLMQIILFLTLGLLVNPSDIIPVIGIGLLISAFAIFAARPMSVFLALLPFRMPTRDRWFVSWVGLRGAVPIVFATYPLIAGIDKAGIIFDIVFFISLTSILVQGTSIPMIAKWLGVSQPVAEPLGKTPELRPEEIQRLIEVKIFSPNPYAGMTLTEAPFPDGARINALRRNGESIIVNGQTVLREGDKMIIACNTPEDAARIHEMFPKLKKTSGPKPKKFKK